MKKLILTSLFTLSAIASQAAIITDFGTSDFLVDTDTSSFPTITSNPTNVSVAGTDGFQIMAGTFSLIDISGLTSISLTGSVSGTNPNSQFFVNLYNSDFSQTRTYSGFLSSYGSSTTSLNLTFVTQSASFALVGGFDFTGAGSGAPLNFTFDTLSATAVPEPSIYTLIGLGLGGLFFPVGRAQRWTNEALETALSSIPA